VISPNVGSVDGGATGRGRHLRRASGVFALGPRRRGHPRDRAPGPLLHREPPRQLDLQHELVLVAPSEAVVGTGCELPGLARVNGGVRPAAVREHAQHLDDQFDLVTGRLRGAQLPGAGQSARGEQDQRKRRCSWRRSASAASRWARLTATTATRPRLRRCHRRWGRRPAGSVRADRVPGCGRGAMARGGPQPIRRS
jgi:hypothetical protein